MAPKSKPPPRGKALGTNEIISVAGSVEKPVTLGVVLVVWSGILGLLGVVYHELGTAKEQLISVQLAQAKTAEVIGKLEQSIDIARQIVEIRSQLQQQLLESTTEDAVVTVARPMSTARPARAATPVGVATVVRPVEESGGVP